ncbi:hypothetical protein [Streptomyces sp. DH37]|uniref:hypothetical protein n=1 Tax=Streptomyces sp. DH37 TaxID=3040122 RepID=UPI002441C8D1|nr:hypothetical protein [Streptomyces sp. DH37]MDG9703032.1 hypothetical protein [Streptomyces sp. DH37]
MRTVDIVITTAVIIGMVVLGSLVIRRLNTQRGGRIAAFRYSGTRPGPGPGERGTEPERWRPTGGPSGAPVRRKRRRGHPG